MSLFSRATVLRIGVALALVSGGNLVHAAREVIENKGLFDYRLYGQTRVVTFDETEDPTASFPITPDGNLDRIDFGSFHVNATAGALSWRNEGVGGQHNWKLILHRQDTRGATLWVYPNPETSQLPDQVVAFGFEFEKESADSGFPLGALPYTTYKGDPNNPGASENNPAFSPSTKFFGELEGFVGFVIPDDGLALIATGNGSIVGDLKFDNLVFSESFAPDDSPNSKSPFGMDADNQWTYAGPNALTITASTPAAYSVEQTLPAGKKINANFAVPGRDGALNLLDYRFPKGAMNIKFELQAPGADQLPFFWYPMHVGEAKSPIVTSPRVKKCKGLPVLVTLEGKKSSQLSTCATAKTTVQGKDFVTLPELPFGTGARFVAYRVNTLLSALGQKFSLFNWFVPGLGQVAQGSAAQLSKAAILSNFTFTDPDDGTTTYNPSSDTDGDSIPYWKEVALLRTNPKNNDTDQDTVLDNVDNCPLVKNGPNDSEDQVDTDEDGVGDACEVVQTGKVKKGVVTDNTATGTDAVAVTLIGCEGLADAMVALPSGSALENVKVTIGTKTYGPLAWTNPSSKKGAYSVVYASNAAEKPIGTVALMPDSETVVVSGKTLDFSFGNLGVVKVELGGWACQSDDALGWLAKSNSKGTVYKAPPLPK